LGIYVEGAPNGTPEIMFNPQSVPGISDAKVRRFAVKAAFCCALALNVAVVHAREVSGVTLPDAISVAGSELRLNGMGMRRETVFFKAYVAGLYLRKPTTDAKAAITSDEAKRFVISMLHDASREMFVHAVEMGIKRNADSAMPSLRARLDLLEHALPALKKGDVLDITYLPGAGTLVRGQGQSMTIQGKDFADALFSVWLGPRPVDGDLKRELLGG